jgi:N-sulfoglucosamine sulfohydrolase
MERPTLAEPACPLRRSQLLAGRALAGLCLVAAIAFLPRAHAAGAARPNFLILLADDLNWRDLGVTGNPDVKTPRIDALARESMTLRGMFTPSPTCSPARHALYTGLFPVRSGAYPNHTMVDPTTKSVFTHLNAIGYRTALIGKQHIQPKQSFPYEYLGSDPDDTPALARFIKRDPAQPWMAVLASNDPHSPWTRGPKELYDPARLTLPPWLHDNTETRRGLAAYYAEISQFDAQVGAALDALEQSGQAANTLVLLLTEQGAQMPGGGKWTLHDNGIRVAAFARWPGRIKAGSSSDALIQYVDVPPTFIAAAGGEPARIDTGCADAAGGRGFDGRSFLGVLLERETRLRDHVFAQDTAVGVIGNRNPYPKRAVRDARYKLIRNLAPENEWWIRGIHGTDIFSSWVRDSAGNPALAERVRSLSRRPAEELYDLQRDEHETNNLAADPAHAKIKARLQAELDRWMRQQGDRGLATELAAPSRQPKNAPEDAAAAAPKKSGKKTK